MVKDIDKSIRSELSWVNDHMYLIRSHLEKCSEGSIHDIDNVAQSYYYRYLAAAMRALKPKQVVELGSAGGASTLMMLSSLPKDSQMIACSIPEPEGEFRFIDERLYPNLTLVRGNDLFMEVWPEDVDLLKTDVWFMDTDHTYQQLHNELRLYDIYFKDGAIIFLDDIHLNDGMIKAWEEIQYPKLTLPDLHHSGFGMVCVSRQ